MTTDLLESLRELLDDELDGVTKTPDGLRAVADTRYAELTIRVTPDEDEQDEDTIALRIQTVVPPPAGAGRDFLLFCLALNSQYWAVNIGLDETGMMVVHADLEADGTVPREVIAAEIIDRTESILQLLDEDMADYLLRHGLGTPAQRARWTRQEPRTLGDPEDDES